MGYQEQLRLSHARLFGQMLQQFNELDPARQQAIRDAVDEMPTHPDIVENDEAIRTIAESFWPDMRASE